MQKWPSANRSRGIKFNSPNLERKKTSFCFGKPSLGKKEFNYLRAAGQMGLGLPPTLDQGLQDSVETLLHWKNATCVTAITDMLAECSASDIRIWKASQLWATETSSTYAGSRTPSIHIHVNINSKSLYQTWHRKFPFQLLLCRVSHSAQKLCWDDWSVTMYMPLYLFRSTLSGTIQLKKSMFHNVESGSSGFRMQLLEGGWVGRLDVTWVPPLPVSSGSTDGLLRMHQGAECCCQGI